MDLMAHFSEIKTDNNEVIRTVVINDDDISSFGENSVEAENWVQANIPNDPLLLIDFGNNYPNTYWKRTSYNTVDGEHKNGGTPFRGNYAGPGFTYNSSNDEFLPAQPYVSYVYNYTTHLWEAPTTLPSEYIYETKTVIPQWNEPTLEWYGFTQIASESETSIEVKWDGASWILRT
tara:strand:+ start:1673 stop:2200 length:528 start_codon:yes stop_codon:yes gene_type:complete